MAAPNRTQGQAMSSLEQVVKTAKSSSIQPIDAFFTKIVTFEVNPPHRPLADLDQLLLQAPGINNKEGALALTAVLKACSLLLCHPTFVLRAVHDSNFLLVLGNPCPLTMLLMNLICFIFILERTCIISSNVKIPKYNQFFWWATKPYFDCIDEHCVLQPLSFPPRHLSYCRRNLAG